MVQQSLTFHPTHHHLNEIFPTQPFDWCKKLDYLTNHLAGSSKSNVATTKWQHKNLNNN